MKAPSPVIALAFVATAALAALLLGAPLEAAAVVAAIGVAGVLLLATPDERAVPPAPAAEPVTPSDEDVGRLLDAVADPLVFLSEGRVTSANRAAHALLGERLAGQDVRLLLRHPAASELLRRDATDAGSAALIGLGGEERQWEMRVSGIAAGRRLIHFVDHSAVRAAERMRVDFVANASHELRTPIAAISGFAETLTDDAAGGDPATRARFLDIIGREASRMHRLIEDLLSLSRIEADRHRPPDQIVDLTAIAVESAAVAALEASLRGADLVVTEAPPAQVLGDRTQLGQVVHNLTSNAFKYGRAGTPVRVAVAVVDGAAVLSVADEGDGIAPEHVPRLTERFYRVDAGRSRAVGGTGLGLAIVKHIVERHRGRLEIASKPGVGTTVTVRLPAHGS